ncbi:heme ABC transporter ATP-binding protein [Alginatibacterium sediminis]|uniref:Heme ABC transporter ATP-binding protein n=1 Tax=Alginatibacterium sediminis TaxID=2164068 RepID=A0A420ECX0_9ALTE|nr:heme ABC transporter ATP-binding protein [Alginatibacterium sediminis]RKF18472.1 heme ABC transporter ATP-binding protein [Alginatibacterium sediminis]
MNQASLALQDISFSYAERHLFEQFSLKFWPNQHCAILGANGAGKSSLFQLASGVLSPVEGQVHIHQRLLSQWPSTELARCFTVLPQQSSLSFGFSVSELILLGLQNHKFSRQQQQLALNQLLNDSDLNHLAQQNYLKLSGGEKQRCHFARIQAQIFECKPSQQILLLDEPTASLDIAHQHQLMRSAQNRSEQGACVISIVHDLNLAARYCQRLILMHQGRVIADGSAEQVLTQDNIHEAFGYKAMIHTHPQLGCIMVT